MSVNSILTKDYERNDIFAVPENKANSNPILYLLLCPLFSDICLLPFSKGASWRDLTMRKSSIRLDFSYFVLDFYVKMGIIVYNWGGQCSLVLARRSCLQHLLNVKKNQKKSWYVRYGENDEK